MNSVMNEVVKVQAPKSLWTRFWRWMCDTDQLEAESLHMEQEFERFAKRNRAEKLVKIKENMRRDVYAKCIAAWTPASSVGAKPSEDLHKKAVIVAERAAAAYMANTYEPY